MGFGNLIRRATGETPPRQSLPAPPAGVVLAPGGVPGGAVAIPKRPDPVLVAPPETRVIARTPPMLDPAHLAILLAQSDAAPERSRSGGNKDGYIHWSSLIDGCPREHCISKQHGLPLSSAPSGPMRVVWRIGRAVEKHAREGIIKAREYEDVYGRWVCKCESDGYEGLFQRGRVCSVCRRQTSIYREPVLIDDTYKVAGSPDLTLVEMGWFVVCEIKSMNKEQFDALSGPLHDHVMQACGYHRLYRELGFKMHPLVRILYVRKDFKFGGSRSIYREFTVEAETYDYQVERLLTVGQDIHAHNQNGTLPDRICDSCNHTRAKGCPRKVLCFQMT